MTSFLLLTACGSSDDNDLDILGTWERTDNDATSYFTFTSNNVLKSSYIEEYECHTNINIPIPNLTASSYTSAAGNTFNYVIDGNSLSIQGITYTRTATDPELISCEDSTAEGNLTVSIEFSSLPESFETPAVVGGESTSTFYLDIHFNLSTDSAITKLWYISMDYPVIGPRNSFSVSMDQLITGTYFYTGDDDAHLTSAPYSIVGNTITFTLPRSNHALLKEITNSTPIKINAYFNDKDGNQQSDRFPSNDYTQGIVVTNIEDALDDVSGSYSTDTIVDIKSVTVSISE